MMTAKILGFPGVAYKKDRARASELSLDVASNLLTWLVVPWLKLSARSTPFCGITNPATVYILG